MEKKKFLLPIAGMIGALLLVLLLVFPLLSMEVKDIPIGVVSLDEGMTTTQGKINSGDQFVNNITKTDNKLINFEKAKSEKQLNKDLKNGKYYASIIVPKDFTKNTAVQKGKIDVVINEGLQPMITMQLSQILNSISTQTGIPFNITSINSTSKLGIKAMLLPIVLVMMTFITSLITSFLITTNIKKDNKAKNYLKQLLYILVMAFVIGFTVSLIAINIANVDINIINTALFITTISLALMLLANGSVNLLGKKGLVIPIFLFVLGMGLIQLPYEYLNNIWQVLIASWEPFRYIGAGLREVLYQEHGIFNHATLSLIIIALIGITFSVINILKREKTNKNGIENEKKLAKE